MMSSSAGRGARAPRLDSARCVATPATGMQVALLQEREEARGTALAPRGGALAPRARREGTSAARAYESLGTVAAGGSGCWRMG